MTEKGDPYENAVAERVNGILKSEWIDEECFESFQAAKNASTRSLSFIIHSDLMPAAIGLRPWKRNLEPGNSNIIWGRKTVVRKAYVNLYQDNIF